MVSTERLYYTNSYLTHMSADVTARSEDGSRIVLDRSVFYPSSGGQPHDLGTLNGIAVVDVVEDGDGVVHVLRERLSGDTVQGEIDWGRRYEHMQQHTGQHLLSAVFEELFDVRTLSFHMGDEDSTIELGAKDITREQINSVILRATELARTNASILISFEDAERAQGLRKASEREGRLRIVEIRGVDRSACGGTHVATLAEVLPLQFRGIEKVRGNMRATFVCGDRAIRRIQTDYQILARTASNLATSVQSLETHVVALQQRLAEAEKRNQRLESEAAIRAGVDLYAGTPVGVNGIRRCIATDASIDENARTKAKAFISQPRAVLLIHSPDSVLIACSPDSGVNAGELLKQALTKSGARGGGSASFAQGNLPNTEVVEELKERIGLSR